MEDERPAKKQKTKQNERATLTPSQLLLQAQESLHLSSIPPKIVCRNKEKETIKKIWKTCLSDHKSAG